MYDSDPPNITHEHMKISEDDMMAHNEFLKKNRLLWTLYSSKFVNYKTQNKLGNLISKFICFRFEAT